jgi:asparagine synthase (glutamine-hydrolysing)
MIDDLLSESTIRRRGWLNPKTVRQYVEEHRAGVRDWSPQIWAVLTFELWQQAFLDASI